MQRKSYLECSPTFIKYSTMSLAFWGAGVELPLPQMVKSVPATQETGAIPGLGRSLGEVGMATHSSILAWRIPWTKESGGLQSMGSQRAGYNCKTNTEQFFF